MATQVKNPRTGEPPGAGRAGDPSGGKSGGGNPFGGAPPPVQGPTKKLSKFAQFSKWAQANGLAGATITDIWYWSQHTPNVDPYLWSSVILKESGGHHLQGNGQLVSSGQAVGIGQIALSWIGQPIPWNKAKKFTADANPETGIGAYGINLRMSAYLWGYAVSKVGWQKAYTDPKFGYNPNDPHKQAAWQTIVKTYNSRPAGNPPTGSPSQGPADTSPGSQTGTSTAAKPFKDPYIAGVSKGLETTAKPRFVYTDDPNSAMQYDGAPLTRSGFLSLKDNLTSHYVSYTGKRPSNAQISQYITKGWNTYTLDTLLSKGKNFTKSPIYKARAVPLNGELKDLLPQGGKIPAELLRQAVLNGWSTTELAPKLRQLNGYTDSNEFKGNVATLLNTHDSIMGRATQPQDMVGIRQAALAGWTSAQYSAYLRSQPSYKQSTEYQNRGLDFLNAMGLLTGQQTVISPTVTGSPGGGLEQNPTGVLPTDPRIKGTADTTGPLAGLGGATLSG